MDESNVGVFLQSNQEDSMAGIILYISVYSAQMK